MNGEWRVANGECPFHKRHFKNSAGGFFDKGKQSVIHPFIFYRHSPLYFSIASKKQLPAVLLRPILKTSHAKN
jgi:hypothetical protein